jgi:hypothetical protein
MLIEYLNKVFVHMSKTRNFLENIAIAATNPEGVSKRLGHFLTQRSITP